MYVRILAFPNVLYYLFNKITGDFKSEKGKLIPANRLKYVRFYSKNKRIYFKNVRKKQFQIKINLNLYISL